MSFWNWLLGEADADEAKKRAGSKDAASDAAITDHSLERLIADYQARIIPQGIAEAGGPSDVIPIPRTAGATAREPYSLDLRRLLFEIGMEIEKCERKFPPMNSAHEALAILLEEVHELQAHVFTNQTRRNVTEMRTEAIQVAAMAIRFVRDITDGGRSRV